MKNQIAKLIIIILVFLTIGNTYGQLTDLARLEYSYIPKEKLDDSFKRFRVLLNYPIKTSENIYLPVVVAELG